MERQYTDWGYIDWLPEKSRKDSGIMRVGIVAIDSYAHMQAHIHFDEQIIYTFQGSGYSLIDGERIDMSASKNSLLHWRPGIIHEMFNEGSEPYVHLMVTCSDQLVSDGFQNDKEKKKISLQEGVRSLYDVIDAVQDQILKSIRYSFVIYDSLGNIVAKSRLFPRYCHACCKESIKTGTAPCMKKQNYPVSDKETTFECPQGLTVFCIPILFRGMSIGHVEGGYVYTKPYSKNSGEKLGSTDASDNKSLYDAPFSSIENVQILLRRIAKTIYNFCEINRYRNELQKQEWELASERRDRELLEADLKDIESSMIDLKINNHFLFNTLNHMAAMALEGGVLPLYQSIIDLSKLFQYTLRQESNTVTLEQELDYLKSYLELQKLRYKDELRLEYDIQVDSQTWRVPFNWLMPLAENAFIHGFKEESVKKLEITALEQNDWLEVTITNNGVCLDEASLRALRIRMRGNAVHGMSMIYQKLKMCYEDQFVMDITSDEKGTKVSIMVPKLKQETEEENL